jgi:hypothetical protein
LKINIDHILIVVKDLEETISFYQHLGFKHLETIKRPNDTVGVIKKDNLMIELMQLPKGDETYRAPRKNSDIGFRHSLRAHRYIARGVETESYFSSKTRTVWSSTLSKNNTRI